VDLLDLLGLGSEEKKMGENPSIEVIF